MCCNNKYLSLNKGIGINNLPLSFGLVLLFYISKVNNQQKMLKIMLQRILSIFSFHQISRLSSASMNICISLLR